MTSTPLRFGILVGSARTNSNNSGIATWAQKQFADLLSSHPVAGATTPSIINLTTYPLPLGPLYDDIVPQALQGTPNPDGTISYPYPSERDRDFSLIIQKFDALLIVSPQYNWSIPGELKNAFDHLFHEWSNLPIAVVTYGGRGGNKAAAAFNEVIGGIRALNVSCGKVLIPIPRDSIAGSQRITSEDEFLKEHEPVLRQELEKLIEAAAKRREQKENAPGLSA